MADGSQLTTSDTPQSGSLHVEQAVAERYSAASQEAEPALCCPIDYEAQYLKVLPQELIDRDYGCGDPSKYVQPGDTVLDLGSGGGKICYIASQIVGSEGRVVGVDMNDDMLALARKHRQEIGSNIGWSNVEFHKGRIQDLGLDLERFDERLKAQPIDSASGWLESQRLADEMRREQPMIPDESIDVVLSNCVLNLVDPKDRLQLFAEIFRVLRPGGRAVISDIVSDRPAPQHLQDDPRLWSGCISGAFVEHAFLQAFEQAGFYGCEMVARQDEPWTTVEGIEFRSLTVRAWKATAPTDNAPTDNAAASVIYRGPWKQVQDDEGNVFERGLRTSVTGERFQVYRRPPYDHEMVLIASSGASTLLPIVEAKDGSDCGPSGCC